MKSLLLLLFISLPLISFAKEYYDGEITTLDDSKSRELYELVSKIVEPQCSGANCSVKMANFFCADVGIGSDLVCGLKDTPTKESAKDIVEGTKIEIYQLVREYQTCLRYYPGDYCRWVEFRNMNCTATEKRFIIPYTQYECKMEFIKGGV